MRFRLRVEYLGPFPSSSAERGFLNRVGEPVGELFLQPVLDTHQRHSGG